jgi:fructose-bisphosphate aldolase, class II
MPLVPLRKVLDHAAENNYGVAAFNVNNMEQIQAIMEAAKETDSPVIIQASRGARSYSQDAYLKHLMLAAVELYPQIPVVMHQDHGNSPATCASAIANNFTSVMMDGSLKEDGKTPADYEYNVQVTADVVKMAHPKNVSVEGELGCLGSLESGHGEAEDGHGAEGQLSREQLLTDPDQAEDFVRKTGVDALAVAIGTSHGAYKFTRKPTGEILAMDRIEAIHKRLPNCHLVMHGSSSVPQELQEELRKYGGDMKQTWGVPVEEIQRGIKHGVRKINVDTDNRIAMTAAIRKVLMSTPEKFDPRDYMKPAREAMKKVCINRMKAFGQAGWANKMKL